MNILSLTPLLCSWLTLTACGNHLVVVPAPPAIQSHTIAQTSSTRPNATVKPRPVSRPSVQAPQTIPEQTEPDSGSLVNPEPQIPTHMQESPALPGAKAAEIRLYRSYGTSNNVHVKARVIKPESSSEVQAGDSKLTSLIRNIKGLSVSELAGVRVRFEIAGKQVYASSNAEGMIELSTDTFAGLKPGLQTLSASVAGGQKYQSPPVQTQLVIHELQDDSLGFISDIDDTIKISDISNKLAAAQKLLTFNPYQAKVVPGTPTLYQILENKDQQADGDFFYLSGSPMNLSPEIYSFLDYQKFPAGAVELKKWGFKAGDDNPIQQENYKSEKLKAIFETYPQKSFLLFGDSSEKDPEIYLALAAEYPGRVKGIFINNVNGQDPTNARFTGVHLTANAAEAAQILKGLNLLTAAEVSQVQQNL